MRKEGVVLVIGVLLVSIISISFVSAESNETEAEECAAGISINFNQDIYRSGDTAEIVIKVLDSQGNGLSNYPFHLRIYSYSEDRWDPSEYPDPEYTNEQGYVEYSSIVDYIPEGDTEKILYKVYTQETSSCSSVEDTIEIEFIAEETEEVESIPSEEEPETVPTVCATKIEINFDKSIYYIGDTAEIVIKVLDSQGNGLSNYVFHNQIYDGIWHTPGEQKTDGSGYFRATPTVEKEQSKLGETKFKVYTNEYSNCNSVEDIATIEIRTRERPEPVPCGIGTCIPEEEAEEPEEIPEEKVLYKCNGCELEGKCYPMGYRKEGKYCSDNYEFIEQLGTGTCDNSFECKSNVCISGECVGEGLMERIIKWFKKLFGGDEEPEEPSDEICRELLIEENINDYEYFTSEYGSKDAQIALYSEDGEQIDIVKCCVAGYLEGGEAKGTAGLVCPFNNIKNVENSIYWLSNKGEIILGEYKGQEVYVAGNAIIWTHKDFIVASGTDPKATTPLPEKIINAYLDKYPNDLGEIEVSEVGELPSNFENLSAKEQVELIHIQNLKYFIAGDVKGMAAAYSSDYLDIGGGPEGTGEVQVDEVFFEEYFSSEKYPELKGKPINELVDLDKKEVYSYEEGLSQFGESESVKYVEGDIIIIFPPKEDSPLFDGWFAAYRKENGIWKITAGD